MSFEDLTARARRELRILGDSHGISGPELAAFETVIAWVIGRDPKLGNEYFKDPVAAVDKVFQRIRGECPT